MASEPLGCLPAPGLLQGKPRAPDRGAVSVKLLRLPDHGEESEDPAICPAGRARELCLRCGAGGAHSAACSPGLSRQRALVWTCAVSSGRAESSSFLGTRWTRYFAQPRAFRTLIRDTGESLLCQTTSAPALESSASDGTACLQTPVN